jgi:hypothetical protein
LHRRRADGHLYRLGLVLAAYTALEQDLDRANGCAGFLANALFAFLLLAILLLLRDGVSVCCMGRRRQQGCE